MCLYVTASLIICSFKTVKVNSFNFENESELSGNLPFPMAVLFNFNFVDYIHMSQYGANRRDGTIAGDYDSVSVITKSL